MPPSLPTVRLSTFEADAAHPSQLTMMVGHDIILASDMVRKHKEDKITGIPDYQSLMLPLMQMIADKKEHKVGDITAQLADHFHLTPEQRDEIFPKSGQRVISNRVAWARIYLAKADLLESPSRGTVRITAQGAELMKTKPNHIDNKFLMKFPGFVAFINRAEPSSREQSLIQPAKESLLPTSTQTPEELIDTSSRVLNRALAQDLLERLKSVSPSFFEKLVVNLLVAMGYGGSPEEAHAQVTGGSGDGGIDGIISEDKLGLSSIYIQAKRWSNPVNDGVVRTFDGSMNQHGAKKGVLITTSTFTDKAKRSAESIHDKKIVLISGTHLAELMIEHNVGVAVETTYVVKKLNLDYFEEL